MHLEAPMSSRSTGAPRALTGRRPPIAGDAARPRRGFGQSLAEFALVLPIMFAVLAGIVQFGVIFWGQITLTQVARDVGRWAATQADCTLAQPVIDHANQLAASSSLIGYTTWTSTNVIVSWPDGIREPPGTACPPNDNSTVAWVQVELRHDVPIFLPGLQYVPGVGTCDALGCYIRLTTATQFRMEPEP